MLPHGSDKINMVFRIGALIFLPFALLVVMWQHYRKSKEDIMFQVRYMENGKLIVEELPTEQTADGRALKLRQSCGVMAWVETDWGEYRYYA